MYEPDSTQVFGSRYGDHPLAGTGLLRPRGFLSRRLFVLSHFDAAIREDLHAVRRLLMRLSVPPQHPPGLWVGKRDGV